MNGEFVMTTKEHLTAIQDYLRHLGTEGEFNPSRYSETGSKRFVDIWLEKRGMCFNEGQRDAFAIDLLLVVRYLSNLHGICQPSRQSGAELVTLYLDSWLGAYKDLGSESEFQELLEAKVKEYLNPKKKLFKRRKK